MLSFRSSTRYHPTLGLPFRDFRSLYDGAGNQQSVSPHSRLLHLKLARSITSRLSFYLK